MSVGSFNNLVVVTFHVGRHLGLDSSLGGDPQHRAPGGVHISAAGGLKRHGRRWHVVGPWEGQVAGGGLQEGGAIGDGL